MAQKFKEGDVAYIVESNRFIKEVMKKICSRLFPNVDEAMMDRFKNKCGSYICNELLGCDITTLEGVEYAKIICLLNYVRRW